MSSKSTRNRKRWLCLDCKVDTGKIHEHFMLKDEIWNQVHDSPDGMICIECIEDRLGRKLNKNDFNSSYVNKARTASQSVRLRSRLTS